MGSGFEAKLWTLERRTEESLVAVFQYHCLTFATASQTKTSIATLVVINRQQEVSIWNR